jgi:hypothetical protein
LFLAAGPVARLSLWGMALLLAVLNLGLFVEARTRTLSLLAILGTAFSWVVIAIWWTTAMATALLLPALVIVGGFSLLIVAGNLWADARLDDGKSAFHRGVYLGLVGHLFVLFVASQVGLALPPWPLFGVLLVLDLAVIAAALYARRGELHAAAMSATEVIALTWGVTTLRLPATGLSWVEWALLLSTAFAALGLIVLPLAERRGAKGGPFSLGAIAGIYGQQLVVALASSAHGASCFWLMGFGALPILALGLLARAQGLGTWMLGASALSWLSVGVFFAERFTHEGWMWAAAVAAVPYVLYSAYPLILRPQRAAHLVAVLASGAFFLFMRRALVAGGYGGVIGLLPILEALVLAGLLARLVLHKGSTEDSRPALLALTAGAALAFVTVAIPLQLEKQWITLGWAFEAAALAWLYGRIRHRGLLLWSFALGAAVVARLACNPAVLTYHARSAVPIWNWYLYSYTLSAAALFLAGVFLRKTEDRPSPNLPRASDFLMSGATALLFLVLNIEIADYYSMGPTITFNFSSTLAQDLTYTLGWAIFGVGLLAAGISFRKQAPRIAALALLVVTVAKCFLHDLWRLGGLYRVGSFVGLALCLSLVAVVMQKFVIAMPKTKEEI